MKQLSLILLLSLLLASCDGDTTKNTGADDSTGEAGSVSTQEPAKKYFEVKSASIEMRMRSQGGKQTILFDDYGNRQKVAREETVGEVKMQYVQITTGGWTYRYDPVSRIGSKDSIRSPMGEMPTDLGRLTEEEKKKFDYKPLGVRTILGKETEGHSIKVGMMQVNAWTWKNIPFRLEVLNAREGDTVDVLEVVKVETDVEVPPETFELPKDVKFESGGKK